MTAQRLELHWILLTYLLLEQNSTLKENRGNFSGVPGKKESVPQVAVLPACFN